MQAILLATAETTTTTAAVAGEGDIPSTWLGWILLAGIVGLYFVVQRTRSRHTGSHRDREAELRRRDPDLRRDD